MIRRPSSTTAGAMTLGVIRHNAVEACQRLLLTRGDAFATGYSPPPPSALPTATNSWVDPDVLDSMIGATRISEASASASAKSFVIGRPPFWRLAATAMDAPFRRRGSSHRTSSAAIGTRSSPHDPSCARQWLSTRARGRQGVATSPSACAAKGIPYQTVIGLRPGRRLPERGFLNHNVAGHGAVHCQKAHSAVVPTSGTSRPLSAV